MRIVVAIDSFKGSLTSVEANRAVCRALAGHDVISLDGTVRPARFGSLEAEREAVIEVAEASGLTLVDSLDPWRYSSYGTGMQILQALERGAKRITLGLGGSATIDGGKEATLRRLVSVSLIRRDVSLNRSRIS